MKLPDNWSPELKKSCRRVIAMDICISIFGLLMVIAGIIWPEYCMGLIPTGGFLFVWGIVLIFMLDLTPHQ